MEALPTNHLEDRANDVFKYFGQTKKQTEQKLYAPDLSMQGIKMLKVSNQSMNNCGKEKIAVN